MSFAQRNHHVEREYNFLQLETSSANPDPYDPNLADVDTIMHRYEQ